MSLWIAAGIDTFLAVVTVMALVEDPPTSARSRRVMVGTSCLLMLAGLLTWSATP